jgi:mannose-6-phosphate isomerase-like protein (cupin superfamily)
MTTALLRSPVQPRDLPRPDGPQVAMVKLMFTQNGIGMTDAYSREDGMRSAARPTRRATETVPAGGRLARHAHSAEEILVVAAGVAELLIGDERRRLPAGSLVRIPRATPHEIVNAADAPLHLACAYGAPDVATLRLAAG